MKKQNYVPTSLDQFLNENRSITLRRQYGEKPAEVVGSRAPMRNQVLAFVMENQKVTKNELKRFIAGLNETSKNPAAAATMWLKRNEKFFVTESNGNVTTYKLSKMGRKLASMFQPIDEMKVTGVSDKTKKEFKKSDPGLLEDDYEEDEMEENCDVKEEEEQITESNTPDDIRAKRIESLMERIKSLRSDNVLNEEDESEDEETGEEEADEEEGKADSEVEDVEDEVETEDDEETEEPEEEDEAGDDKVEVTEFVITVDDAAAAIAELSDLGIEAKEVVADSGSELDMEEEPEEDLDLDLGDEEGEDDLDLDLGDEEGEEDDFDLDFDLDLEGDFAGEEESEEPDVEESVTGMEKEHKAKTPNLVEDDEDAADELSMGDLGDEEGDEVEGEEEELEDLPAEDAADELDMEEEPEEDTAMAGETQIVVKAEDWEKLKPWLEGKGVDIEDTFGGEIEMEGDGESEIEGDEISFDGLEDVEGDEDEDDQGMEPAKGITKPEEDEDDEEDDEEEDEDEK